MDILITESGEVAAISSGIEMIEGGYRLIDGSVYPAGLQLIAGIDVPADLVGKRLSYADENFTELEPIPAPKLVPREVDPMAALYMLDNMGLLSAYAAWADAPERTIIERETLIRAQKWQRDNPLLNAAAAEIGITQDQLDEMFMQIGKF